MIFRSIYLCTSYESDGSLSWVNGLKSPTGWLPVHRDQLPAQRSVTSIGKLYTFYLWQKRKKVH